jgi:hypothetical protein
MTSRLLLACFLIDFWLVCRAQGARDSAYRRRKVYCTATTPLPIRRRMVTVACSLQKWP